MPTTWRFLRPLFLAAFPAALLAVVAFGPALAPAAVGLVAAAAITWVAAELPGRTP